MTPLQVIDSDIELSLCRDIVKLVQQLENVEVKTKLLSDVQLYTYHIRLGDGE